MMDECPEDEVLAAFAGGGLTAEERGPIESHLVKCKYCLETTVFVMRARTQLPASAIPRPENP